MIRRLVAGALIRLAHRIHPPKVTEHHFHIEMPSHADIAAAIKQHNRETARYSRWTWR